MQTQMMKRGYTLLEILIVIVIIAALIATVTPNFMVTRENSRDAKRKQELKIIQNALEQHYTLCGYVYPTYATGAIPSSIFCINVTPTIAIMPTIPKDPQTTPYRCNPCRTTGYTICTTLESETPSDYCLSSLQ